MPERDAAAAAQDAGNRSGDRPARVAKVDLLRRLAAHVRARLTLTIDAAEPGSPSEDALRLLAS